MSHVTSEYLDADARGIELGVGVLLTEGDANVILITVGAALVELGKVIPVSARNET